MNKFQYTEDYIEFVRLTNMWLDETKFSSHMVDDSNESYKKIIEMGKKTLPWILNDMKNNHHHWFVALNLITGENPINPEHAGYMQKMIEDWLEWAKLNHIRYE